MPAKVQAISVTHGCTAHARHAFSTLSLFVTIATETRHSAQNVISQQEVFNVWLSRSLIPLKIGKYFFHTTENRNRMRAIFCSVALPGDYYDS